MNFYNSSYYIEFVIAGNVSATANSDDYYKSKN